MVAQPQPQPMDVTRPNVVAWVQALIDDKTHPLDPVAAFKRVWDDMDRLGQLEDLARLHGPSLVGDIWREKNAAIRRPDGAVTFRPDTQIAAVDREQHTTARTPTAPPPPPVIPIPERAPISSMDGLHKIGSEWVMIRHLTKAQCLALSKINAEKAGPFLHYKAYFLALAAALDDEVQTVGQKLDDRKLARLYRNTRP